MKIRISTNMAWLPLCICWLAIQPFILCSYASATGIAESLFDAPRPAAADEIFLLSTRAIGTTCNSETMTGGLKCRRYASGSVGSKHWQTCDWRRLLSVEDDRPTIVYVHGNRVDPGKDGVQGLQVYESFRKHTQIAGPVRFIIWSWPSSKIPRPIKDYRVKARRTTPAAWQLAWLLDKLPVENPISLIGYSYGTRVVSGASHILADGELGTLRLANRVHPRRPPVRVALIAAAYEADWIQPRSVYGRSISQIQQLVLGTNELDPAMRFFHLSTGRKRMDALGKSGVHNPRSLGTEVLRLRRLDFTSEVGKSHALEDYLAAESKMKQLWQQTVLPLRHARDTGDPLASGYSGLSAAIQASQAQ